MTRLWSQAAYKLEIINSDLKGQQATLANSLKAVQVQLAEVRRTLEETRHQVSDDAPL